MSGQPNANLSCTESHVVEKAQMPMPIEQLLKKWNLGGILNKMIETISNLVKLNTIVVYREIFVCLESTKFYNQQQRLQCMQLYLKNQKREKLRSQRQGTK
jgi:hypothetical protein